VSETTVQLPKDEESSLSSSSSASLLRSGETDAVGKLVAMVTNGEKRNPNDARNRNTLA
jgi:hypothetical protein